jgi:acyl-CoA thioesterase-1
MLYRISIYDINTKTPKATFNMRYGFQLFVTLSLLFLSPVSVAQEDAAPAPYRLVMLGDSLTAGFNLPDDAGLPAALDRALDARGYGWVEVINAGVSGDTTEAGLARFNFSIGPEADGVLIALGANDALQGQSPTQARENLTAMVDIGQARSLDVALAGMLAPLNMGREYRDEFDGMYLAISESHSVPLYPFLLEAVVLDSDLLMGDGLHPTARGIDAIAEPLAEFMIANLFADMSDR